MWLLTPAFVESYLKSTYEDVLRETLPDISPVVLHLAGMVGA